tara:strand:- start:398 stop:760 length:363 start_codon:yes stop_codon:yes gene_type:complete
MFQDCGRDDVREQITRVLLERLIVHRPHPWGLLISFIELIKNPRYKFWSYGFTRCASEIEKVFESVARSCMAGAPNGNGNGGGGGGNGGGGGGGRGREVGDGGGTAAGGNEIGKGGGGGK